VRPTVYQSFITIEQGIEAIYCESPQQ